MAEYLASIFGTEKDKLILLYKLHTYLVYFIKHPNYY